MDKKNTIIGVLFIGAAFIVGYFQQKDAAERADEYRQQQAEQAAQAPEKADDALPSLTDDSTPEAKPEATSTPAATPSENDVFALASDKPATSVQAPATGQRAEEEQYVLKNEAIAVTFSTWGGAIKHVEFIVKDHADKLKYPATIDQPEVPYVFNAGGVLPALAISLDTDGDGVPEEFAPTYELIEAKTTDTSIAFRYRAPNGILIRRVYEIRGAGSEEDPYVILHNIGFTNESDRPLAKPLDIYVNVGTAPPTEGDVTGTAMNFGYYDGDDAEFVNMSEFKGSKGFLGFGASAPVPYVEENVNNVVWAAIKNQFFVGVLTPRTPGVGIYATDVDLGAAIDDPEMEKGMTGAIRFDLGVLTAGESKELGLEYYVGPKEFPRLSKLGQEQDLVMQFGFFAGISKLLLYLMIWIHGIVAYVAPTWGWGFTIIIVTIIIKTLLFPLTQIQVRSAKRMSKIQPMMQELREKHKDNPQEMQKQTLELFRKHKVNPAAGCLPLILQIPIFFALFYMLRTVSELRFAPFLWIPDLSVSDTMAVVMGFPVNPLPLIMAVTMFVQMQMMPTPTTDNMQRTIFKFMPLVFLLFCYNFPSGLVLYWTCQNLFTICQQWITNRRSDDEPDELEVVDDGKPRKPSFRERLEKAKAEQDAAKKRLAGRGSPTTKKKKKR